jgi:hypothetical protein
MSSMDCGEPAAVGTGIGGCAETVDEAAARMTTIRRASVNTG